MTNPSNQPESAEDPMMLLAAKVRGLGPLERRLDECIKRIQQLSEQGRVRMSVPVEPTDDDILLICTLLDAKARIAPAQPSASRESIALIIKGLSDISRRVIVADLPAFVMELQDKAVELRKIAETALSELAGGDTGMEACDMGMSVKAHNAELSQLRFQLASLTRELEELKKRLEPGTAPAIVWGIFQEAERLGFYKPTYKHALTQFVEQVEKLTAENLALRGQYDELREFIRTTCLALQNHRSLTTGQKDELFQKIYRLYVSHNVENRRPSTQTGEE